MVVTIPIGNRWQNWYCLALRVASFLHQLYLPGLPFLAPLDVSLHQRSCLFESHLLTCTPWGGSWLLGDLHPLGVECLVAGGSLAAFGCKPWWWVAYAYHHWCSLLIAITILLKSGNLYTHWCTSLLAFTSSSHLCKKMHLQFVMFWWAWAWVYFTIWVWPCAVKASQVIMTELNFNFFFSLSFKDIHGLQRNTSHFHLSTTNDHWTWYKFLHILFLFAF
jgi:hypothetical protein